MAIFHRRNQSDAMKMAHIHLREWRKLRGLTQERLAGRLDTTAATISRWENEKAPWSAADLRGIAAALQCEPEDLFRNPHKPEGRAWRIIRGMKPDQQERAARILEALISEDNTAA